MYISFGYEIQYYQFLTTGRYVPFNHILIEHSICIGQQITLRQFRIKCETFKTNTHTHFTQITYKINAFNWIWLSFFSSSPSWREQQLNFILQNNIVYCILICNALCIEFCLPCDFKIEMFIIRNTNTDINDFTWLPVILLYCSSGCKNCLKIHWTKETNYVLKKKKKETQQRCRYRFLHFNSINTIVQSRLKLHRMHFLEEISPII